MQDLSSAVDLLVWSPLANHYHYRSSPIIGFRLAGAQGGAFSRRSRKVQQPACAHARTARPHIHLNTQILSATDDHVALSTRRRVRLESHCLDNGQLGQSSSRVWSSSAKKCAPVNKLCNVAQSARSRRETYIGPWLPEPVDTSSDPHLGAVRGEALEFAVLLLLEKLSPTERAAYVFRKAFD